jgi:hypothetical protein
MTAVAPSSTRFQGIAAVSSIAVGIGGLLYAVLFALIVAGTTEVLGLWLLLLMAGGLVGTAVMVGLYERLRETDPGLAMWAMLLGVLAGIGGTVQGADGLAHVVNPNLVGDPGDAGPDPFGILRYAVAGITFLLVGWLILRGGALPRGMGWVAVAAGATLLFIYVGRLYDFITPATKVTLIPPFLYGFVFHPVFYIWLGMTLRRPAPAR